MRRLLVAILAATAAVSAVVLPATPAAARFAGCNKKADFDRNGYHDLAVGVRFEDVGKRRDAGAVNVILGGRSGLSSSRDQYFTQNTRGVAGVAEVGDSFGEVLAIGDFDGNGYSDLAVGVPREDAGMQETGAVQVLYGRRGGLGTRGDDYWTLNSSGIRGHSEGGDAFGSSLAAGDFNRDGYSDLAIGTPNKDVPTGSQFEYAGRAGAVTVLYGSRYGLTSRDQYWTQQTAGVASHPQFADRFGHALTSGDFDGDGYCDLAVGAPGEDSGASGAACSQDETSGICNHGAVNILYGGRRGLSASGDQFFTQNTSGVADTAEDNDLFGYVLTSGNFDDDSYDDLAIAVPHEAVDQGVFSVQNAGAVNVLYGTSRGLSASGDQFWHQDTTDGTTELRDVAEDGDEFGIGLTYGDFNSDGNDDLAIGAPGEDIEGGLLEPTIVAAGGVNVIYGSSRGLRLSKNQHFNQDSPGLADAAENGDNFGMALAAGRYDYGKTYDLVIGVPTERVSTVYEAGVAQVLYGSRPDGVSSKDQFWSQASSGIADTIEDEDWFGYSFGG